MQVPFCELNSIHQSIKSEVFNKLAELFDRTEFVYGETAKKFEKNFAVYNGTKYAVAVDNGTNAIELALRAIGVKPGDEVLTVANTFIATVAGIHFTGAKPVFVDINPKTWNMDVDLIESKITEKTRAILPVHLYGQPAEMIKISEIASKYNLKLIGDSAQSIGSKICANGIWKSTSQFADLSTFSFYPGKNLGACGEAGAVVTDNQEYAEFIAMFRDHGSKEKYIHEFIGRNNRIDAFQAAILDIKLNYIDEWNARRKQVADWYFELLSDVEEIQLPTIPDHIQSVFHLFVILVDNRANFQQYLSEHGIGTALHYKIPVHLQKAFQHLGYKKGDLPVAESVVSRNVSLPMFPDLTFDQVKYVANTIKNYFAK
jgi:dTDP-4-amino-4,6-dideoxygalactose transaminase